MNTVLEQLIVSNFNDFRCVKIFPRKFSYSALLDPGNLTGECGSDRQRSDQVGMYSLSAARKLIYYVQHKEEGSVSLSGRSLSWSSHRL